MTIPMPATKTATVFVLVGTGSKYETRDINGISHFLEHMMFKGTTKRPGTMDIAKELDAIGADLKSHWKNIIKDIKIGSAKKKTTK